MKGVWSEETRLSKLPSVETAFLDVLGSNMLRMESVRELHYNRCMGSVLTEYMRTASKKKDMQALYLSAGFGDFRGRAVCVGGRV